MQLLGATGKTRTLANGSHQMQYQAVKSDGTRTLIWRFARKGSNGARRGARGQRGGSSVIYTP